MEETEGLNLQTIEANVVWCHGFYSGGTCSHSFPDDSNSLISGRSLFDEISDLCQVLNFCNFAIRQNPSQAHREKTSIH